MSRIAQLARGVAAIALAGGLLAGAAQAKDCRYDVPLPADASLTPAAAGVPADIARFAGAWLGTWLDELCTALVVEEIHANGFARVVLGIGTSGKLDTRYPWSWRATARVIDNALRFRLPYPFDREIAFRLDADTLQGTESQGATANLRRAPDLADVRCAPLTTLTPAPPGARDHLTAGELYGSGPAGIGPVHNGYFMPVGAVAPARHALRGTITLSAAPMAMAHHGCRGLDSHGPAFTVGFFTEGDALVPVMRDIGAGGVILSPGRVWSEPGDGGLSRASFPFAIVNPLDSVLHNGIATFLFDDRGVSALRFQFVQETAPWERFDFWGQVPLHYAPGAIAGEEDLRAQFRLERRQQMKIEPWSNLPSPVEAATVNGFDGGLPVEDISASGLVVDGILYLRGCNTRYGPYPYCRDMRHSVYSVTKSAGAAIALLRLAQKYGDQVFDLKTADYVPITAGHNAWQDVTFADALNMTTGVGDLSPQRQPNDPEADESKPRMRRWVQAKTAKAKLDVSFSYGKYPWPRGEVVRYNSTQTFVLAAAMDAFLKSREGPTAHLWDMVVDEVLRPIGVMHAPALHTLEDDASRGIPILASGLFPTIEDMAKLAVLLQNGGRHDGRQLLHPAKLAEALYRVTPLPGIATGRGNRFGEERYHLSFWSIAYRARSGCTLQIPYMAGSGGNLVVLMPNGISAIRFADALDYDKEEMILAGEAVQPLCPPASAGQPAADRRVPLTASEVRAELDGNTFYGGSGRAYVDPGGLIFRGSRQAPLDVDVGRWWIDGDGHFCRAWNVADHGRARCELVYRDGDTFEFSPLDRWTVTVLRRVRGNPEGF